MSSISYAIEYLRREGLRNRQAAGECGSWWKGEAAGAYRETQEAIDSELSRLLHLLEEAEQQLRALDSAIARAEGARRAEAARRAWEAEQAKKQASRTGKK